MKNKKIAVLLKYFKGELNPFDGAALECALETGAQVTAVAMSPASVLPALQSLTRLGVKAVLISDPLYAGSDTQATSYVLAEALKRISPDMIFCGRQSVHGDTAQVPPMLAQRLGLDFKPKIVSMQGSEARLRSGEICFLRDNAVYTFEKIKTLRFPSIFSKIGEVEVWNNQTLGLPAQRCGLQGSPTRVVRAYESSVGRRYCSFMEAYQLDELIASGLERSRKEWAQSSQERLETVGFVGNVSAIAQGVAHRAIEIDACGKTPERVAEEILDSGVKHVIWEDSEELKTLAARVAVITGAGLCADCIAFRVERGNLVMTRPAQGGNVTADIVCEGVLAFATARTAQKDGADVVFSVGKGGIEQIEKITELAKKYGAEVCCSRSVADSGRLPYEKQVGLTGRVVSPKVYVAFGISGAVQHTCAIEGAGTVIAVNTDKNARIFDYADYGIITEVKNVEL